MKISIEEKRRRNREHKRSVYSRDRDKLLKRVKVRYLKIKKDPIKWEDYLKGVSRRVKTWIDKNPEKRKAHQAVFVALRAGNIKKKKCFCGKIEVEAHHSDYSKPLKIIWFCKKHHKEADIRRRKVIHTS